MSKYDEMSDAQIDYLVKGIKYGHNDKDINRLFHGGRMNFCNNPNDAWPIIFDNKISIEFDADGLADSPAQWANARSLMTDDVCMYQVNPLRAAMIVFLMMKEDKQCN